MPDQQRSPGGGIILPAGDLEVGDRLEFQSSSRTNKRYLYARIEEIHETPKTVRLKIRPPAPYALAVEQRLRKTTMVARAMRDDELEQQRERNRALREARDA